MPAVFVDATADAGLDFTHFNGMSGEMYFCEVVGAGAALFDYDDDGDLDAYLVQGAMLGPDKTLADASFPPRDGADVDDRLYRTELASGSIRFTDVTRDAGVRSVGYGMGVAAADFDNDGWVDL